MLVSQLDRGGHDSSRVILIILLQYRSELTCVCGSSSCHPQDLDCFHAYHTFQCSPIILDLLYRAAVAFSGILNYPQSSRFPFFRIANSGSCATTSYVFRIIDSSHMRHLDHCCIALNRSLEALFSDMTRLTASTSTFPSAPGRSSPPCVSSPLSIHGNYRHRCLLAWSGLQFYFHLFVGSRSPCFPSCIPSHLTEPVSLM